MGNNAFKIGNFDDYEKQLKRCKIALLVGLILGILTIVFYVFAFINTSGGYVLLIIEIKYINSLKTKAQLTEKLLSAVP